MVIKIFLNTILGVVLIIIWLKFVNIGEILQTLSKVNLLSLAPVYIFMLLSPIVRGLRLKVFLAEIKKIKLKDLIFLNGVAMMLNYFIPIRAGEIAKGIYLKTQYNLKFGKSIIWVFIDRFVDFLVVIFFTAFLLVVLPTNLPPNFVQTLVLIFGILLVITYLAIFQANFSKKIVKYLIPLLIEKHIKRYFELAASFVLDSFSILKRHPKDLVLMIGITILAYAADAFIWYFTFIALGFPQDFFKMYLSQLLSALTYLIPAAPGYVGSAEASGLVILSGVLGMGTNLASAMIVLFHILSVLFVLIFGLISVYNLKINLRLILKKTLQKGD